MRKQKEPQGEKKNRQFSVELSLAVPKQLLLVPLPTRFPPPTYSQKPRSYTLPLPNPPPPPPPIHSPVTQAGVIKRRGRGSAHSICHRSGDGTIIRVWAPRRVRGLMHTSSLITLTCAPRNKTSIGLL